MNPIEWAKSVWALVVGARNVDAYQKLDELSKRVYELEGENRKLKDALALREALTFRKPFFYREGDLVPYCPRCYEADGKAIHLDGPERSNSGESLYYRCKQCENFFDER